LQEKKRLEQGSPEHPVISRCKGLPKFVYFERRGNENVSDTHMPIGHKGEKKKKRETRYKRKRKRKGGRENRKKEGSPRRQGTEEKKRVQVRIGEKRGVRRKGERKKGMERGGKGERDGDRASPPL